MCNHARVRILVSGSREWTDKQIVHETLRRVYYMKVSAEDTEHVLLHGCARGIDEIAEQWAIQEGCWEIERYPAEWTKYQLKAGPIRNQKMIDVGKPDAAVVFWDGKSRGTLDTMRRCIQGGVPVTLVGPGG